MQIAFFFILLNLCLVSCGIYNSSFQCPPGEGVGCASVGEVMDMIVEKEHGEDLFLKNKGKPLLSERQQKNGGNKEEKLVMVQSESGEVILVPEKEENRR